MKKFVIDRSEWLHGEYITAVNREHTASEPLLISSLYNSEHDKFCCLGLFLRDEVGFNPEDLENMDTPSNLLNSYEFDSLVDIIKNNEVLYKLVQPRNAFSGDTHIARGKPITSAIMLDNDNPYRNSELRDCLLYTSPSPRDRQKSRMPSSA